MKPISDADRATLFLYLTQNGLPSWQDHEPVQQLARDLDLPMGQAIQVAALAMITGWTRARAKKAIEAAVQCGYADAP